MQANEELRAADDGEPADLEDLMGNGFDWSADGTALVLKTAGPEIVCGVERRQGEDFITSLSLHWPTPSYVKPKYTMVYQIEDDPTRGHVRRLVEALGVKP